LNAGVDAGDDCWERWEVGVIVAVAVVGGVWVTAMRCSIFGLCGCFAGGVQLLVSDSASWCACTWDWWEWRQVIFWPLGPCRCGSHWDGFGHVQGWMGEKERVEGWFGDDGLG
jgi:hypothetical protein